MSTRDIVKVKVEELTRYGFKDADGYVSWSKNISESDKSLVVPGATFEAEYYTSEKGTRYLNKIVARDKKVEAPKDFKPVVFKKAEAAADLSKALPAAKASEAMTKTEWQAKDRSQLIGGLSHDAATLVASFIHVKGLDNSDEAVDMFRNVINGLLKVRDELK